MILSIILIIYAKLDKKRIIIGEYIVSKENEIYYLKERSINEIRV